MSHRSPSTRSTKLGFAGLAFAAASLVAVPVASATSPTGGGGSAAKVDAGKARCEAAFDKRITRVNHDLELVKKSTGAPAADRATLTAQLVSARTTITDAKAALHAAHDPAEVKRICKTAIDHTRVFVLDGPKVRSVVATSRLAKVDAHVAKVDARFDKAIARAEQRGVPAAQIADAKTKAAEVKASLAAAHHDIDGLSASLLPITPAQVNDHSAKDELESAHARMASAKTHAQDIRKDLAAIVKDLRPSR